MVTLRLILVSVLEPGAFFPKLSFLSFYLNDRFPAKRFLLNQIISSQRKTMSYDLAVFRKAVIIIFNPKLTNQNNPS